MGYIQSLQLEFKSKGKSHFIQSQVTLNSLNYD